MFCKNCGNQIPDGVRFCPKCGKETGTVPSNQNAAGQDVINKNTVEHSTTAQSTVNLNTMGTKNSAQSGWSAGISEESGIKKTKTKKQRYLRTYNLGHFGVLIGCVMEIVAVRNVEIYQNFRDYTETAAIMLMIMGLFVLVSFICVLLKFAPVVASVFNLAAIGVLLYMCSKLTSVFQGQGYLLLLAGGVVIFVSSVISSMMTSNMLMRQRVQLTKY